MAVPMVQIGSWRLASKWAKYNEMLFIYLYIFAFFENNILSVKSLKTSFADVRHFKPVWQNTIRNYRIDFKQCTPLNCSGKNCYWKLIMCEIW